jgi:hypothetical protein
MPANKTFRRLPTSASSPLAHSMEFGSHG